MRSRRSDGRVAAGCRAAVRTGGFSARERGGAREDAGPRVGYSRCGAARRSRRRRRDSWPTSSHVGDFFFGHGRLGPALEVLGCVVFVVLGASGGDGRPPFTKDEQYAQRLLIGFVASVLLAARFVFDNCCGLGRFGSLRARNRGNNCSGGLLRHAVDAPARALVFMSCTGGHSLLECLRVSSNG